MPRKALLERQPACGRAGTQLGGDASNQAAERARQFAALGRVHLARLPVLVFVVAAASSGAGAIRTLAGALATLAIYAAAAAINDIADLPADTLDEKLQRPLVSGQLAVADATRYALVAGLVAVALSALLVQPISWAILAVTGTVAVAYSVSPVRLKGRPTLAMASLGATYYAAPVLLAEAQVSSPRWGPAAGVALGLVVVTHALAWHKDVADEAGDHASGTRTPVVAWGWRPLARWSPMVGAIGAAISLGSVVAAGAWPRDANAGGLWDGGLPGAVALGLAVVSGTGLIRTLVAIRRCGAAGELPTPPTFGAARWWMVALACTTAVALHFASG